MSNLYQTWIYKEDKQYLEKVFKREFMKVFKREFMKEYPEYDSPRAVSYAFLIHKLIQLHKGVKI